MMEIRPRAYIAYSGGKDSTALLHLASSMGVYRAMSVKDDLDFPGELEYVTKMAKRCNVKLDIINPPESLQEWLKNNGGRFYVDDNFHSRSYEFSNKFYLEGHQVEPVILRN